MLPDNSLFPELKKLHIYLTDKCNSRCRHCWVEAAPEKDNCLDADEVNRQIEKAIPLGLQVVKVTGGEPLLFPETLFRILEHCNKLETDSRESLETRLETNATLIDDEKAKRLSESGAVVYTSLDGSSSSSHDNFRGYEGSFRRTLTGIETLFNHGVDVNVISCIHHGNLQEIDEIIALCNSLGTGLKFNFPSPYGRGKSLKRRNGLLGVQEIITATHYIEGKGRQFDIDVPRIFRQYPPAGPRCECLNILSLLPDGRYSLCGIGVTHPELTFGYLPQDIREVWQENEILQKMRETIPDNAQGVCSKCKEYQKCYGHCLAYSLTETGSLFSAFPLCETAFVKEQNVRRLNDGHLELSC